jgi:WD40 repeat protein
VTIGRDDGSVEQHAFDGSAVSGPARQIRPGVPGHFLGRTIIAARTGLVATTEPDGSIAVTDAGGARTGRISQPLPGERRSGLAAPLDFSSDGQILAVGVSMLGEPSSMTLWDVSDPARPRSLGAPIPLGSSLLVAFSPDRPLLTTQVVVRGRQAVQLIDISDPARPVPIGDPLTGHTNALGAIAFSPDGRILATGAADRNINLWDVTDPADPRRLGVPLTGHALGVKSLALSPDGRTMASGSSSEILLWDLTDLTRPRRLGEPLAGDEVGAAALVFSADGNILITGVDRAVSTWDLTELNALRDNARRIACERTGRGLTPDEWARYVTAPEYEDTCSS